MTTFKKDIDQLNSFWENYNFIIKSLNEYNNGDESETKRIAVSLRSLFHTSKSILNQIGKTNLEFYDSRLPKFSFSYNIFEGMNLNIINLDTNNLPYYALNCRHFFKKDGKYLLKNYPLYAHSQYNFDKSKKVLFIDWWEQEIFDNLKGDTLTRKQLITYVSNKEGVAHLDIDQNRNYENYKMPQVSEFPIDGEMRQFEHLTVAATIAQIAFEVIKTVEDNKEFINQV